MGSGFKSIDGPVLFVSPAKSYPVDEDGTPFEPARADISIAALTILGDLKSKGFDVDFIDLAAEGYGTRQRINGNRIRFGLPDEYAVQRIGERNPLALLVNSTFSCEHSLAEDLVSKVRAAYPDLPIIAGGIHATAKPHWLLDSGIDLIIRGEGEDILPEILQQIASGKKFSGEIMGPQPLIRNLDREWAFDEVILKANGDFRYNLKSSIRGDLYLHNTLPEWDRSFLLYYSKGCPVNCDFCTATRRDGSVLRHMGSERMFRDFVLLHQKYGVKIFYNEADAFGSHPEDMKFLKDAASYRAQQDDFVLNNPNGFYLKNFFPQSNGHRLDERYIDLLAEAGFNVVTISVETFNQRFNKKVDFRNITQKKIKDLISAIRQRGMKTEIYIMYGFPTETRQELHHDETIAADLGADSLTFHTCVILPATEYHDEGMRQGWFDDESYRKIFTQGYTFYHQVSSFNFTSIPDEELKEFRLRHRLKY